MDLSSAATGMGDWLRRQRLDGVPARSHGCVSLVMALACCVEAIACGPVRRICLADLFVSRFYPALVLVSIGFNKFQVVDQTFFSSLF